jgi:hypothetical protein
MYEELAEMIKKQIADHEECVKLTLEQAMKVYLALLGMNRIQKIANSNYGGSELFQG